MTKLARTPQVKVDEKIVKRVKRIEILQIDQTQAVHISQNFDFHILVTNFEAYKRYIVGNFTFFSFRLSQKRSSVALVRTSRMSAFCSNRSGRKCHYKFFLLLVYGSNTQSDNANIFLLESRNQKNICNIVLTDINMLMDSYTKNDFLSFPFYSHQQID